MYQSLPARNLYDTIPPTDVNQLNDNIEYVKNLLDNNVAIEQAHYSPYYVQSSAPSSPEHGCLWYDTDDNKLYKYNIKTTNWTEIDWQTAVKATPEWQAGKLRINNGMLQISDAQPVWRDCYPLYGSTKYKLNDTTKKYFLPINSTVVITGNIIPIVFCLDMITTFHINGMYSLASSDAYVGLWINETSVLITGVFAGTNNYSTYAHTLALQGYSVTTYKRVVGGFCYITIGKCDGYYTSINNAISAGLGSDGVLYNYVTSERTENTLTTSMYYLGKIARRNDINGTVNSIYCEVTRL